MRKCPVPWSLPPPRKLYPLVSPLATPCRQSLAQTRRPRAAASNLEVRLPLLGPQTSSVGINRRAWTGLRRVLRMRLQPSSHHHLPLNPRGSGIQICLVPLCLSVLRRLSLAVHPRHWSLLAVMWFQVDRSSHGVMLQLLDSLAATPQPWKDLRMPQRARQQQLNIPVLQRAGSDIQRLQVPWFRDVPRTSLPVAVERALIITEVQFPVAVRLFEATLPMWVLETRWKGFRIAIAPAKLLLLSNHLFQWPSLVIPNRLALSSHHLLLDLSLAATQQPNTLPLHQMRSSTRKSLAIRF